MSTFGQQFEAMMAEAAAKAIEEWVKMGQPSDILTFTRSFFSVPQPISPAPEKPKAKKEQKKKCTARTIKGKMCSKCARDGEVFCSSHLPNRAELEPSDAESEEGEKKPKAKKCCAVTAKGTKCTKNAKEGSDKCSIHSKEKAEKKEVKKTEAKKKSETRGSVVVLQSILEEDSMVDMKKIMDMELDAASDSEEGEIVEEEEAFDE